MCPSTAEAAMYASHCEMWRQLGCKIEAPVERQFGGIPVKLGPILSISPHFAISRSELSGKFPQASQVHITLRGALVILGSANVIVQSLDLDGALVVDTRSCERDVKVVIQDVRIQNAGWEFVALQAEEHEEEVLRVRGYRLVKHSTELITLPRSLAGSFLIQSVIRPLFIVFLLLTDLMFLCLRATVKCTSLRPMVSLIDLATAVRV